MGIVFISIAISATIGAATAIAVYRISRRLLKPSISLWMALPAGLVIAGFLFMPVISRMARALTTTIIGMSSEEAARRLDYLLLPDHSTNDICYRISGVGVTVLADFEMTETDFLRWMEAQQLEVVKFDLSPGSTLVKLPPADTVVYPVRQYESRLTVTVKRGCCYFAAMDDNPDNTDKVIYDLDTGRVYVESTTY